MGWLFLTPRRTIIIAGAALYAAAFLYIAFFDASIFSIQGYPIHNGGDSGEYATLTQNIATHGTFSLTLNPKVPEMFRSPGYPLFLAPLYLIDHSFYLAILVQILMVIGSVLFIYYIGASFLPSPWPVIAALGYALDPTTIFYSLSLWSDGLFVFLTLLAAYLLFVRPASARLAALAGLALGYAALVRSAGTYLIWMFALFFAIFLIGKAGWKKCLTLVATLLIASGIVLAPWYLRNHHESGVIGLSTTGPYTFLFYHVKGFEVGVKGMSETAFDHDVLAALHASDARDLRNLKYASGMMGLVKAYVLADPIHYGIYHVLGTLNFFLSSSIRDAAVNLPNLEHGLSSIGLMGGTDQSIKALLAQSPFAAIRYALFAEPLLSLERALRLTLLLLAAFGFFMLLVRRRMTALVMLCAVMVAYTAIVIGPVSYPRYRMPAEPFILLLAAAGATLVRRAKIEV